MNRVQCTNDFHQVTHVYRRAPGGPVLCVNSSNKAVELDEAGILTDQAEVLFALEDAKTSEQMAEILTKYGSARWAYQAK